MPHKICSYPGCGTATRSRRCAKHTKTDWDKQVDKDRDRERLSARERGYDSKWRKARLGFLKKHPLCENCLSNGRTEQATEVDHIIPHRGDKVLFWDRKNWQGLCKPCHSRKTRSGL